MKKLLALLFVLCSYPLWATTLTGTIKNPDGTGVNGSFLAKLVMNSSQKATGSCAGPNQIVPTTEVRFPLSNGAFLPANPTIVGNDCLLPLNTYYIVRVTDSTGRTLFTDNWIITGTTIDVGTIVSANITALQTTVVTGIGTGTQNSIARWLSSTSLGNSGITDDGTVVTMTEPISRTYNGSAVASNLYLKSNGTTQFVPSTLAAGGVGSCVANNFVTAINADAAPTCAAGLTFPLLAPDGTTSAPSYSFTNATGTGMWRDSTGLEFSVGGTNELQMTSGQIRSISDGSAATPALSFTTATNTGIYKGSGASGVLAFVVQGVAGLFIDNNGNILPVNGGNIGSTSFVFAQTLGSNGGSGTPTYSFGGATNTGMYKTSNGVQFTIAGTNSAGVSSSGLFLNSAGGGLLTIAPVSTASNFTLTDPALTGTIAVGSISYLTSNYTNATTTFSDVTGLSFAVAASTKYKIRCDLDYQTSATTADIKIQWTGPASPTFVTYDLVTEVTGSSLSASVATAFSTSLSETGTPTTTTNFPMTTTLTLSNGVNAGTVQLQAAATGTGTVTIIPGSCSLGQ